MYNLCYEHLKRKYLINGFYRVVLGHYNETENNKCHNLNIILKIIPNHGKYKCIDYYAILYKSVLQIIMTIT